MLSVFFARRIQARAGRVSCSYDDEFSSACRYRGRGDVLFGVRGTRLLFWEYSSAVNILLEGVISPPISYSCRDRGGPVAISVAQGVKTI